MGASPGLNPRKLDCYTRSVGPWRLPPCEGVHCASQAQSRRMSPPRPRTPLQPFVPVGREAALQRDLDELRRAYQVRWARASPRWRTQLPPRAPEANEHCVLDSNSKNCHSLAQALSLLCLCWCASLPYVTTAAYEACTPCMLSAGPVAPPRGVRAALAGHAHAAARRARRAGGARAAAGGSAAAAGACGV
jgi:hypothetical protein